MDTEARQRWAVREIVGSAENGKLLSIRNERCCLFSVVCSVFLIAAATIRIACISAGSVRNCTRRGVWWRCGWGILARGPSAKGASPLAHAACDHVARAEFTTNGTNICRTGFVGQRGVVGHDAQIRQAREAGGYVFGQPVSERFQFLVGCGDLERQDSNPEPCFRARGSRIGGRYAPGGGKDLSRIDATSVRQ